MPATFALRNHVAFFPSSHMPEKSFAPGPISYSERKHDDTQKVGQKCNSDCDFDCFVDKFTFAKMMSMLLIE